MAIVFGARLVSVNAWVIPEQIAIAQVWKAFDVDAKLSERFDEVAQSLVEHTQKLRGLT